MLMRRMGSRYAVRLQGVGWVSERDDGDQTDSRQRGPSGAELIGLVLFAVLGRVQAGGALAAGLILGTTNGLVAAKLISLPLPFVASSLLRLMTLSMAGVAIGLALGLANIWLVILGLGVSQFVL